MKNLFLTLGLLSCMGIVCAQTGTPLHKDYAKIANYDESKVPTYTLPDVLLCQDGEVVKTKEQWEQKRRPELLEMLTTYMYGKTPVLESPLPFVVDKVSKKALNGKATRKEVTICLTENPQGPAFHLQLYLPNKVKGKIPVFLGLSFTPNYTICDDPEVNIPESMISASNNMKFMKKGSMTDSWQLNKILEHGYGLATFCYSEVTPDKDTDYKEGIQTYYYRKGQTMPDPDQWGAVAAWAWAASRAMDYLVKDDQIDAQHVAIIGHSRLGKTALWAGATDSRFALVIPANSGCCGAAISRRCFGETVEAINVRFPHWFCGNYKQFNARENYAPFDQHEVVALVAPRPIYIPSAQEDNWSDQKGEFLGGKGAEPVYALYNENGIGIDSMPPVDTPYMDGYIAYHNRKGPHAVLPYDWEQFLKFADRFFKVK